jgi:hypothetical protein
MLGFAFSHRVARALVARVAMCLTGSPQHGGEPVGDLNAIILGELARAGRRLDKAAPGQRQ